jgi:hypothetical protein
MAAIIDHADPRIQALEPGATVIRVRDHFADGCTEIRFVITERQLVIPEGEFSQLNAINTRLKEFVPEKPLWELRGSSPSWLFEALGTMLLSILVRFLHPDQDDEWLQSKVAKQISTEQHLLLVAIARDDAAVVQSLLTASGDVPLAFEAFRYLPYIDHPNRGVRDLLALESFCNNLPPEKYVSMRSRSESARTLYQNMKDLQPFTHMKRVLMEEPHNFPVWYHVPATNVSFTDLLLHQTELTYIGTCCHGTSVVYHYTPR